MFCPKCGKQLSEEMNFCSSCGAPQSKVQNSAQNSVPEQNAVDDLKKTANKNKNRNIAVSLVVVLVAALVGRFVIAPILTEGLDSDSDEASSVSLAPSQSATYSRIFSERNIVEMPETFFRMDYAAYACTQTSVNGSWEIIKEEFGYKDDIVKAMVVSYYYPIEGMSNDDVDANITHFKYDVFAEYDALDFAEVTCVRMGDSYLKVKISFSDLDVVENVNKLAVLGHTPENGYISMSKTEADRLKDGYVKE